MNLLYNDRVLSNYFGEIQAVAFDIDGTLYKEINLNIRVFPRVIRHPFFFSKYNKARKVLRKQDFCQDFRQAQIDLMGQYLHCSAEDAGKKLDTIVYNGLKKYFKKFGPYKGVYELICRLEKAGVKIALLSDFPPEQKGDIWGIKEHCHVILGSEEVGALKPSPFVFTKLAESLGTEPAKILYVGNHHKYDVVGPKKAGMKAAWIISPVEAFLGKKSKLADLTFSKYSQLENKIFD